MDLKILCFVLNVVAHVNLAQEYFLSKLKMLEIFLIVSMENY